MNQTEAVRLYGLVYLGFLAWGLVGAFYNLPLLCFLGALGCLWATYDMATTVSNAALD